MGILVNRRSVNIDTRYLPRGVGGWSQANLTGPLLPKTLYNNIRNWKFLNESCMTKDWQKIVMYGLEASIDWPLSIFNMRGPRMTMHRLPLFVWFELVTTFLLLLSFPKLAGVFALDKVAMPCSNLTIWWESYKDDHRGTNNDNSPSLYIKYFWPNLHSCFCHLAK
jgi:hypothetical protein